MKIVQFLIDLHYIDDDSDIQIENLYIITLSYQL